MNKPRILVVDDDPDVLQIIEGCLSTEGFDIVTITNSEETFSALDRENPDLVILDVLMPGLNGLEVCRRIREKDNQIRILMLTGMDHELDKVRGLEIGADDYVTKPFGVQELGARVKALLRRVDLTKAKDTYLFGDVAVNLAKREVTRNGQLLELTAKEFDLLCYLIQRPGEPVTRDDLLEELWGIDEYFTTRTVDNYILRLRKKLEPDPPRPRYFVTLHGVGYKFLPED